jgi:hypothetical protein
MITKEITRIKEVKDIFRISDYDLSAEATYTLAKLLKLMFMFYFDYRIIYKIKMSDKKPFGQFFS